MNGKPRYGDIVLVDMQGVEPHRAVVIGQPSYDAGPNGKVSVVATRDGIGMPINNKWLHVVGGFSEDAHWMRGRMDAACPGFLGELLSKMSDVWRGGDGETVDTPQEAYAKIKRHWDQERVPVFRAIRQTLMDVSAGPQTETKEVGMFEFGLQRLRWGISDGKHANQEGEITLVVERTTFTVVDKRFS